MATLGESLEPVEDDSEATARRESGFPQVLKYMSIADRMKKALEADKAERMKLPVAKRRGM